MEKQKVLVIEDEEDMNELLCSTLEDAGFHTISSLDGDDGLKKAIEESPDIIILDIMIPKLDGIGVCRALKATEKTKSIPVIMVTAKSGLSDKLQGYISGAQRYIVKPFDTDDLVTQVHVALHQHKISGDLDLRRKREDPKDRWG